MTEQDKSTKSLAATCRVFISYSHDSTEHEQRVRALADGLRANGIEAWADQYVQDPEEGWIKWMRTQVKEAEKVLLVFTETYQKRFEGDEEQGKGLGVTFEGVIVTQALYEKGGRNAKFRPVVFCPGDTQFISEELRRFNCYRVDTEENYEKLLRWLHQAPLIVPPEVSQKPDLPAQPISELFPIKTNEAPVSAGATYALIVGIDKYEYPDWDVSGPCTNALAIANWLLSNGVPPVNLTLFLSPAQGFGQAIDELRQSGVKVQSPATCDALDSHCRSNMKKDNLGKDCPSNSRLLVYWSGHGCTTKRGDRIFFCSDYTSEQTQHVFYASNFLRRLRSYDNQCFDEQIVLADVCGVYNGLKCPDLSEDPGHQRENCCQIVFFATPEGKYAYGLEGRGVFTDTILEVLSKCEWPTHKAFPDAFHRALDTVGPSPFRIRYSFGGTMDERLVGSVPKNTGNEFFMAVYALLSCINLSDSALQYHYRRTVNDLGNPELAKAQGLIGMLKQLSSLQDAVITGQMPYGLLQFLIRLTQDERLKQPITEWLEKNAAAQKNAQETIREKLYVETQQKTLIVAVEHEKNDAGNHEITKYEALLRNSDSSPVDGVDLPSKTVNGWNEFKQDLQALVDNLRTNYSLDSFDIHFAVDPPLFDRPFHQIPVTVEGLPLGHEFVVLVRHLERNRSKNLSWWRFWKEHADAIRSHRPSRIMLLKIDCGNAVIRSEKGLWFASFVLPPSYETHSSCQSEKLRLATLLRLGAPYLYWLHHLPAGADEKTIKKMIRAMLKSIPTLDGIPLQFMRERIRGNAFATEASILWDDPPELSPFASTRGVSFR
jgi:hypothetical protein